IHARQKIHAGYRDHHAGECGEDVRASDILAVLLSARGISKHFDGTQALCNVDLDIAAGTVHALVGENGAGKSTLAKIIAGVVKHDSGEMSWDGAPDVGMIFQELD